LGEVLEKEEEEKTSNPLWSWSFRLLKEAMALWRFPGARKAHDISA
jgi:hypothetical protein